MAWIKGKEILERPGWTEFVLKKAYGSGLSPYRNFDDARMVCGSKCCFNCKKASPNFTPGFLDEQGNCIPIKLPNMPEGLAVPYSPLELALKIDPALVDHFFRAGEFVFHSGVFGHRVRPQVARLLTGVLGASTVERLMLEGICTDFDPMGYLDMGDRLKASRFRLSDVEAYGRLHGIGQAGEGQVEAPVPVQVASELYEEENGLRMRLPTRPGTAWDQIRIRIAKNDRFEIGRPGYDMEAYNTQELGLQKARTKLALLKAFGLRGGELKKYITKDASPANMSNLRKHISGIFPGVEGNPIQMNEDGCYVCQFQICVNEEEFSREYYTSDDISDERNDWEEIMGARS